MKVSFEGKKLEFSQVLAEWLAKGKWSVGDDSGPAYNAEGLAEIMEGRDAEDLLRILQAMVSNRIVWESMIGFAARYKTAVMKAEAKDIQEALDFIKIMEVQSK